ncbi:MAG TPA: helical backbone metal receptor [Tepidiformaceae bacterium]|nr:helical backbone metal receptor [Tepidiformaceae bacterium]
MIESFRVVSLVPSLTELICWLGREDWLVGRTRFCTEPREMTAHVPALGGTKDPDVGAIVALQPGLVLANREENRREDVDALAAAGIEVLVTDPGTVAEALGMVTQLGALLDAPGRAAELVAETRAELQPPALDGPRVLIPIWWKPLMAMGGDCYGNDVLVQAGGRNVLSGRPRYPELSLDEAAELKPDLVLLPDEPYAFRKSHVAEFAQIAPARVIDGKLLWWYGPRMPAAIRELRAVLREARPDA